MPDSSLTQRISRLSNGAQRAKLHGLTLSAQTLRGISSRATLALASFYLAEAAAADGSHKCAIEGYPGVVLQGQLHLSSIQTIALCCRKAFDHADPMSGSRFGRSSELDLDMHATYWSKQGKNSKEECLHALKFLRDVLVTLSKKPDALYKEGGSLGCRIGFIKQYASQSAAHISLDHYEFDSHDLAHVVAALSLVGAAICHFDSQFPESYFRDIDEAAHAAAERLFPESTPPRLFRDIDPLNFVRRFWGDNPPHLTEISESLLHHLRWID